MNEDDLRAVTIGEPRPLAGKIEIADYDPAWPVMFAHEAARIRSVLADRLLLIEHVGSTSVPGLAAKPRLERSWRTLPGHGARSRSATSDAVCYVQRLKGQSWKASA